MEKLFQSEVPFPKIIQVKYIGETKEIPVYLMHQNGLSGTGICFGKEVFEVNSTLLENGDIGEISITGIWEKEPNIYFSTISKRAEKICTSKHDHSLFVGKATSRLPLLAMLDNIVIVGVRF